MRVVVAFLIVISLLGFQLPSYCQEVAKEVAKSSVPGTVVSVDKDKSVVVVEYIKDPVTNATEKMEIIVTPDVKLKEKDVEIILEDLDTGDEVIIEGIMDNSGKLKVESIYLQAEETPEE